MARLSPHTLALLFIIRKTGSRDNRTFGNTCRIVVGASQQFAAKLTCLHFNNLARAEGLCAIFFSSHQLKRGKKKCGQQLERIDCVGLVCLARVYAWHNTRHPSESKSFVSPPAKGCVRSKVESSLRSSNPLVGTDVFAFTVPTGNRCWIQSRLLPEISLSAAIRLGGINLW